MSDQPKPEDIALVFARVFRGGDGARVLAHLRAITIDRVGEADMSDQALRHLEGQRSLARYIENLVKRGQS